MRNFLVIMILGHISHNNEKLCLTEKLSHNNKTLSLTYLLLRKCNVIILNGICKCRLFLLLHHECRKDI